MFVVGLLSWWYGDGWRRQFTRLHERIESAYDYFSIDLLAKTLFSPYRQISAGSVNGPLAVKWRAFVDRLVSRIIGAVMRSFLIIIGIVTIVLTAIIGSVFAIMWAAVPFLPLLGALLWAVGLVPLWM